MKSREKTFADNFGFYDDCKNSYPLTNLDPDYLDD
jgi:hypothetical protein